MGEGGMQLRWGVAVLAMGAIALGASSVSAQPVRVDVDPSIIQDSPVLQRWLVSPPDLLNDIYYAPIFGTKLRVGLMSRDNRLGLDLGIEDLFIGASPVTLSGSYQTLFPTPESSFDLKARYYVLPLGSYVNIAPQVGYRQVNALNERSVSGVEVGLQGILVLSPRSADLRFSHGFTNFATNAELSVTAVTASYALGRNFWLGSKIEWRRSPLQSDSRVGIMLEINLP
jgi:hypothetical protein